MSLITLFSCSNDYILIEGTSIEKAFALNSSPTFKGYYYQGSDENFHYFIGKWKFQKDKKFKFSVEDLCVKEPYNFMQHECRVDLFKLKNSIKFGENDYAELYKYKN